MGSMGRFCVDAGACLRDLVVLQLGLRVMARSRLGEEWCCHFPREEYTHRRYWQLSSCYCVVSERQIGEECGRRY